MRLVVKVGTSTLAYANGRLNIRLVEKLCKVLSDIKNSGVEVLLVTSGAIGMGVGKLMLPERPKDLPSKQACAAVGQSELMYVYDKLFSEHHHVVGQVLLTGNDVEDPRRCKNVETTLLRLLELGALPVINENDTVGTEEIEIGDNDTLSAIVARLVKADLLVLLSDVDGLYDKDPHKHADAKRIAAVKGITKEVEALAGSVGSSLGTGGMETKIKAAKMANEAGIEMVIALGETPEVLYGILEGNAPCTRFVVEE